MEGGEELLLSGSNFLPISRVLFMERGTGKGPQTKMWPVKIQKCDLMSPEDSGGDKGQTGGFLGC